MAADGASLVASLCAASARCFFRRSRLAHVRASQRRTFIATTPIIDGNAASPDASSSTPPPFHALDQIERQLKKPTSNASSRSTRTTTRSTTSERVALRPFEHYSKKQDPAVNRAYSPQYSLERAPQPPGSEHYTNVPEVLNPGRLTPDFVAQLALLAGQGPHYITVHIHGKPYLVTVGDTVRLPFLMHGVTPGDVLRLDRASVLGSRDWTLRAGAQKARPLSVTRYLAQHAPMSPANDGGMVIGPSNGTAPQEAQAPTTSTAPFPGVSSQLRRSRPTVENKVGYIDPSLFLCRATVLGVESEPTRVMEKTKRRQRHVKHVYSKHRYTILRISEVEVKVPAIDFVD